MSAPRRRSPFVLPLVAAIVCTIVPVLALLLAPEGRLACREPGARETSPDGAWTLTLCQRPMLFSVPGGGSDAPGWIVLRDRTGAIRGVQDLAMVQMYSGDTTWAPDRVARSLVTEMPLRPAANPFRRWLDDRVWRLRALLGLVATDADFR